MEKQFLELCQQHELIAVGVSFHTECGAFVTVYLHWGDQQCVSGNGKTFDDALALALEALRLERSTPVHQNNEAAA